MRLCAARGVRGWSLDEAFRRTGVPADILGAIETGAVVRPQLATLVQLAAAYDLDLIELMAAAGHDGRAEAC